MANERSQDHNSISMPVESGRNPLPRSKLGSQVRLREALATDVQRINEIAVRSKASWGYSTEQVALWRDDLVVDATTLGEWPIVVAESEGQIVGFAQLDPTKEPWFLARLFVDPNAHGQGIGRCLLRRMQAIAAAAGQKDISIDSDPNAAPFYLACGGSIQNVVPSPIPEAPDRTRPQLLLRTNAA